LSDSRRAQRACKGAARGVGVFASDRAGVRGRAPRVIMFCDEVLDAIEPIAAGELTPDGRVAAHLTSCPNCAAALASARRVEQLLQARPIPKPAALFTTRTMALIRRRRWRREQFLDAGFNLALMIVGVAVAGAVWMALHRSGLIGAGGGT